ncbi:uncharacterized protein LOC114852791 isoform X2 [Betta splendens]|nr:uncharacterized protein LOC114852791 isoform X2 [Betta splendens]
METRSSLPELFLLLLVSTSASGLGSVLVRRRFEIPGYSSWTTSQTFCRSSSWYKDLVTLHTRSDEDSLNLQPFYVWVGLQKGLLNNWTWINGQALNTSRLPIGNTLLGDSCAYYSYMDNKFYVGICDSFYFFLCSKLNASNVYEYTFINQSKTWSDARLYCQNGLGDLGVSEDDLQLKKAVYQQDYPAWIGLYRDGATWSWSAGLSEYRNWAPNEPGNNGDCVAISSVSKTMTTQNCSARYPFICFVDNLLLVKENRTWEEALEYCKELNAQLVSVQPEDYTYISDRAMEADTDEVWTGLRFLAGSWFWTNGASLQLPELPLCPLGEQHCGAFSRENGNSLATSDCSATKNFLCYSSW